jgi:hypothetical protein
MTANQIEITCTLQNAEELLAISKLVFELMISVQNSGGQ